MTVFAVLAVYGAALMALGIILMMATGSTSSEKAALSRARRKRARKEGRVKARVHYDNRVKRHSQNGAQYW